MKLLSLHFTMKELDWWPCVNNCVPFETLLNLPVTVHVLQLFIPKITNVGNL